MTQPRTSRRREVSVPPNDIAELEPEFKIMLQATNRFPHYAESRVINEPAPEVAGSHGV